MNPTDIIPWVSMISTVLAVIIALFKEDIISIWHRPKLVASIHLNSPDCHKTTLTISDQKTGSVITQADCYYFRLWIENKGNLRAEQVQVFASRLLKLQADGTFREEKQFLPMNLRWSNSRVQPEGPEIFAKGLSPFMGKHCDLGHIVHPKIKSNMGETLPNTANDQTILALDTEVTPNTRSNLIKDGIYRLELKIASANSNPVVCIIEINLTGKWFDNESEMFSEGIGIKTLKKDPKMVSVQLGKNPIWQVTKSLDKGNGKQY